MSQATPQQSLNQQINLQVKGAFITIQQELEVYAKNKVLELQAQLMDPAFIFEKLSSFLCDPKVQEKIHKTFDKILNFLEKNLLGPVGDVKNFLQKIMDRIIKIRDQILGKINDVLAKLQEIVSPLNKILRVAPLALNALTGLAAAGGLIDQLGRAITAAKNFIGAIFAIIADVGGRIKKYVEKCFKFVGIIGQAHTLVNQLYNKIDQLIQYAKFLLLAYEGFCLIEETPDVGIEDTIDNEDPPPPPIVTLSAEDILNKVDKGTNIPDLLTSAYQQLINEYTEQGIGLKAERLFKLKSTYVPGSTVTDENIEYMTNYRVKLITQYNQSSS
tara:strand:+ start:260 stop:1249 length:990 start_codon:yes stop_codon:yes gene_type:complete